jgi:hypothetical protein
MRDELHKDGVIAILKEKRDGLPHNDIGEGQKD